MKEMVLRNCLFKLLQTRSDDGWLPAFKVDGVSTSDERNEVAEKLVALGCLSSNWKAVGRTSIQGTFDYNRVKELIVSGKIV